MGVVIGVAIFMAYPQTLFLEIIHAPEAKVLFTYPMLPVFLHELQIKNLQVGKASVDLHVRRHKLDVGVTVMHRQGDIEVVVVK